MTNITINTKNATIELTKVFAKNASRFGSEEYKQLQMARADYPNYRVITKSTSKGSDHFKGLTYAYMEKYMNENKEDALLKEYYTLCGKDENGKDVEFAATATYGQVKEWFIVNHPQLDTKKKSIDDILKNVREQKKLREQKNQAA